jgi:hypothetical protein
MTAELTGVSADIYRAATRPNASNGGVSSRADEVTVVAVIYVDDVTGITEVVSLVGPVRAGTERPAVAIVHHKYPFFRSARANTYAMPYHPDGPITGWQFGGTFIAGDSRISDAARQRGGLPFHDRRED